uniref:Spaetzle domain-containing protein n=1 Tax=Anopheles culicifacies TaxID=139723 RepID=A0A182M6X7_9DIPT
MAYVRLDAASFLLHSFLSYSHLDGLRLVVCGFLFGLILAPIDGRLKYAEVFPSEAFQKLLLTSSDSTLKENDPDSPFNLIGRSTSSMRDKTTTAKGKTSGKEIPNTKSIDDVGFQTSPLNCFPLADRLHKYDWARYFLRHMAVGSSNHDFPDVTDGGKFDDSSLPEYVVQKRSDFNREISTDLYAQYPSSCACQTKYELLDLGYTHFPRYIVNAICQNRSANSRKCWRGSSCKEIPYKVRVLTKRNDNESGEQDHHSTLLPEPLREYWRFKTVTIAAACQCSI